MELELFDTHCHLTHGELRPQAAEAWIRARDAGVVGAILVGIDAPSSAKVIDDVGPTTDRWCTVGIHPNHTAEAESGAMEEIRRLSGAPRVVALGETGLDTHWDDAPMVTQLGFLEEHCALAIERDLPVVLHLRDAFSEARSALAPWVPQGLRAVVHCFAGGPEDLEPFLEWGFLISFSGILTYPRAQRVRDAARLVPPDRCLLETDAPWLAPAPRSAKEVNEPAYIRHTAKKLASVWDCSLEHAAAVTTANARRFFRLDPPPDTSP